jgi:hypothetical protein
LLFSGFIVPQLIVRCVVAGIVIGLTGVRPFTLAAAVTSLSVVVATASELDAILALAILLPLYLALFTTIYASTEARLLRQLEATPFEAALLIKLAPLLLLDVAVVLTVQLSYAVALLGGRITALATYLTTLRSSLRTSIPLLILSAYDPLAMVLLVQQSLLQRLCSFTGNDLTIPLGRLISIVLANGTEEKFIASSTYCLRLSTRMSPSVLITGATGAGKSFTAKLIASRIRARGGAKVVIIDPHGEYGIEGAYRVNVAQKGVNLLVPVGDKPRTIVELLVSFMKQVYRIGPRQEHYLREALLEMYYEAGLDPDAEVSSEVAVNPTLVLSRVASINEPSALTLLSYLHDVLPYIAGHESIWRVLESHDVVVFDVSGLPSTEHRRVVAELVARSVYGYARRGGIADKVYIVVVVDEAHTFIPRGRAGARSIASLVVEARKYGVSAIIVTQTPGQLDDVLLANIGYRVILPMYEYSEIAKLLQGTPYTSVVNKLVELIAKVPKGTALVYDPNLTMLVKVRLAE